MRSSLNNSCTVSDEAKGKSAAGRAFTGAACGLLLFALSLFLVPSAEAKTPPAKKVPCVKVLKCKDGRFRLTVGGKPYVFKGACYNPVPIGQGGEYDWWGDPCKPWLIDGKLMQQMGINTVRIYQPGEKPEEVKAVLNDLYRQFGIRVTMGHWLGFWEYPAPLYGDKDFRERIKKEVLDMVCQYKDEPAILCWVLGNENNYSSLGTVNPWTSDEIDKEPDPVKQRRMRFETYYSFIKELTDAIHAIDPNHPVALGNGELIGLEYAAKECPNVDMIACIIYRGKNFGSLFKSLKNTFDKPVMLSEFGADAFDAVTQQEDQNQQAFFLDNQWRQIYANLYDARGGEGNCLGGTMFEWTDEWWKHNVGDPAGYSVHDTGAGWANGNYYFDNTVAQGMNMNEEWFGLVSVSPEKQGGIDKRVPRKAYYVIRDFWKNPCAATQVKPPVRKEAPREKIRGMKISGD